MRAVDARATSFAFSSMVKIVVVVTFDSFKVVLIYSLVTISDKVFALASRVSTVPFNMSILSDAQAKLTVSFVEEQVASTVEFYYYYLELWRNFLIIPLWRIQNSLTGSGNCTALAS